VRCVPFTPHCQDEAGPCRTPDGLGAILLRARRFFLFEEGQVLLPWRLRWTLAQFCHLAEYRKHSAVLRSAPAFYFTILEKMIPGFSSGMRYLALTDGHVIPVRDFMTLYIYKEIFVDRCYDLTFDQSAPVIIDIGANSGLFALRIKSSIRPQGSPATSRSRQILRNFRTPLPSTGLRPSPLSRRR
jgi:hypothetical protein